MTAEQLRALAELDPNSQIEDLEDPFVQVWNSFWINPDLTLYEKAVWITLKTFARGKKECFPSQGTIAKITGIGRSTVIKALQGLVEKGGIVIVPQESDKKGNTSNLYFIAKVDSTTGKFITESLKAAALTKEIILEKNPQLNKPKRGGRPTMTAEQKAEAAEQKAAAAAQEYMDAKKALAETSAE